MCQNFLDTHIAEWIRIGKTDQLNTTTGNSGCRHEPGTARIPCNQCHFSATKADALKRHIEAEHEGKRFIISLILLSFTSLSFSVTPFLSLYILFVSLFVNVLNPVTLLILHIKYS